MTKKEARARADFWKQARQDGRVLRINHGATFTAYPTQEATAQAFETLKNAGVPVMVVKIKPADVKLRRT